MPLGGLRCGARSQRLDHMLQRRGLGEYWHVKIKQQKEGMCYETEIVLAGGYFIWHKTEWVESPTLQRASFAILIKVARYI